MTDTFSFDRHRDVNARLTTRRVIPMITSVPLVLWANGADSQVALARRNLADRTLMGVTGTPVVNAGYARTTGNTHLFKSNFVEPATFTWFVFGRRSDTSADNAHTGVFGGSFAGSGDAGCIFYWQSSTILRGQASQGASPGTPVSSTLSVASGSDLFKRYRLECVREGGVGTIRIFNDTDGTADSTPGEFSGAPYFGASPVNIGAAIWPSFLGHIEWNHQSIFAGIPTEAERNAHWAHVLRIATKQGAIENS